MGAERIVHTGAIMAVTSNFKVNVEPKTNIALIPYNYLQMMVDTLKIICSFEQYKIKRKHSNNQNIFYLFANYSK